MKIMKRTLRNMRAKHSLRLSHGPPRRKVVLGFFSHKKEKKNDKFFILIEKTISSEIQFTVEISSFKFVKQNVFERVCYYIILRNAEYKLFINILNLFF